MPKRSLLTMVTLTKAPEDVYTVVVAILPTCDPGREGDSPAWALERIYAKVAFDLLDLLVKR